MKILKENNELEKRAKKHKATDCKGARGWFVTPDPGNPEAMNQFNNSVDNTALGEKLMLEEDDLKLFTTIEGINIFTDGDKFYDEDGYEFESISDILDYYFPGEEIEIRTNEDLNAKDKSELKKIIDATDDEETISAYLKVKKDGIDENLNEAKNEIWEKITNDYRRWACLSEDVDITEDNIDDYALNRTAVMYQKPTEFVKSRLLKREKKYENK